MENSFSARRILHASYRSVNTSQALFVLKVQVIEQLCALVAKYLEKAIFGWRSYYK